MSLFGGDQQSLAAPTLSPSPSPLDRSPSLSDAQDAQDAPPLPSAYVPDPDDSLDEDFQPSSPDAEPAPLSQRNVKPNAWRRFTEADRGIAASLEDIESADLAAHLYNAHALKRRLRRPIEQLRKIKDWQSKDAWLKKGDELRYKDPLTGDLETELVPSKLWTAWPVPPSRLGQRATAPSNTQGPEDGWYIGSAADCGPREVMREELLALFLRTAKENWDRSQIETGDMNMSAESAPCSPSSQSDSDSDAQAHPEYEANKADRNGNSTSNQGVHSINSNLYVSETEGEQTASDGNDSENASPNPARQQDRPHVDLTTEAVFLADDDQASRILEPSINSLLSRIDRLTLALHLVRSNHAGDGPHRSGSGSDYLTDGEPTTHRAGSTSRPGSRSNSLKKTTSRQPRMAKKKGHTPRQPPHGADSDSASIYGADLESADGSASEDSRTGRRRSISSNGSHHSNASSNPEVRRGVGLMDWSELLGLAAIAGFDKDVIANTAQRCASLFGEKMNFRTFDEHFAAQPIPEPVQYLPCTIPASDEMQVPSNDVATEPDASVQEPANMVKRPYFDSGSLRCPHTDCAGSLKDFSGSSRLTEHVRRKHGYDPRTNDSDNEERTVGGVHIDGYLQPIWARPGWLGHGRAKSEVTDNETQVPRRKRQRLGSKPTSTVTSAYTTQDEQEDREQSAPAPVRPSNVALNAVPQPNLKKACTNCSRRKRLCDGERPCERCRKLGEPENCEYRVTLARVSCSNCRRRKQRCDYEQPCARCERNGQEDSCQYPT